MDMSKRVTKKKLGGNTYQIRVECLIGPIKEFIVTNEYVHPYLHWENLVFYDEKWEESDAYLHTALDNKLKLCVSIITKDKERVEKELQGYNPKVICEEEGLYQIVACREGCLADYFDVDEIIDWYEEHGIYVYNLEKYFYINMHDLMTGKYIEGDTNFRFTVAFTKNDFVWQYGRTGFIVIGLLLGYPLEATYNLLKKIDDIFD